MPALSICNRNCMWPSNLKDWQSAGKGKACQAPGQSPGRQAVRKRSGEKREGSESICSWKTGKNRTPLPCDVRRRPAVPQIRHLPSFARTKPPHPEPVPLGWSMLLNMPLGRVVHPQLTPWRRVSGRGHAGGGKAARAFQKSGRREGESEQHCKPKQPCLSGMSPLRECLWDWGFWKVGLQVWLRGHLPPKGRAALPAPLPNLAECLPTCRCVDSQRSVHMCAHLYTSGARVGVRDVFTFCLRSAGGRTLYNLGGPTS